jgi:hypothetical protein
MVNQINIFIIILILIFIIFLINKYLTNNDESPPFPIDVVYTWKGEEVTNDVRTSYNHELQYSLRSIDLYAPWVNKIYILTDYPKNYPSWIKNDTNKIIMIDTTETFPHPSYLPNSNSNAIESTISNIKNLSEHYIYFCDDIFLGKKTKYTDFFTYDGKAIVDKYVLETSPILINEKNNINNIKYPPSTGRMYKHIPIPQIKSCVQEFYEEYSEYIHWVRMTKKRNNKGFDVCQSNGLNTPCQQIHYPICKYMYAQNKAIPIDNDNSKRAIFVKNKYDNLIYALNRIIVIKPLFFCINDDQTDVSKREEARNTVLDFFEVYFPNKPEFEK